MVKKHELVTKSKKELIEIIETLDIKTKHLENDYFVTRREQEKTTIEFLAIVEEIRKKEKEIRESEERYREAVENSPNSIFYVDKTGRIQMWNKASETTFGYGQEIMGKKFKKLIDLPELFSLINGKIKQVFKNKTIFSNVEISFQRSDGTRCFTISRLYPLLRNEKEVQGCVFANTDITGQKKAKEKELELINNLAFLSKAAMGFVEQTPKDNIYTYIKEQLIKFANNAYIFINSYDSTSNRFQVQDTYGFGEHAQKIYDVLGSTFTGRQLKSSQEAMERLLKGELLKVPGGLYELAFREVPRSMIYFLERLLNIGDVFVMGIAIKGEIFGSIAFLVHKGAELRNKNAIETFIRQASVALQRRKAEEEIMRYRDQLEQLVEARTSDLRRTNELLEQEVIERKTTELMLRESEKHYRLLAENVSDIILTLDMDFRFTFVSSSVKRVLGYSMQDILSMTVKDIMTPSSYKASINVLRNEWKIQKTIEAKSHRTITLELEIYKKNRSIIWLEVKLSFFHTEDKKSSGILGVARDINERKRAEKALKKSEERLRGFMDSATESFILFESNFNISEINREALRILKKEKKEILGKNITYFAPDFKESGRYDRFLNVIKTGIPYSVDDIIPDSKFGYMHLSVKAFKVGEGLGLIVTDITERVKVTQEIERKNQELERMNEELRSLDRLKDNFISTVSHELRTPLTSIKGSIGLLLGGKIVPIDDEMKEFLNICYRNTDRLIRLINAILDLSKLEEKSIELDKTEFDLEELVYHTFEELESLASSNSVRLISKIPPKFTVFADRDRIAQVIHNLLSNSIKFAPEEKIEVFALDKNHEIEISVLDNGPGISPDMQMKIFNKFVREDSSTKRKTGGTGLGLAISKAIVEEHNGKIWVESEKGKGSKFAFTIPKS